MNEQNSLGADFRGALGTGLLVLVFCEVLLWHHSQVFWQDDYQISILPVFADVARSWSEGQLPLLSPYSWACGNLAGEYQYGTFSIFVNALVILIWKFPLGFAQQAAALSVAHLFVLGAGAFLLARGRKLSAPLAMMVGLVGALNGWIICWGARDWFGALGAFAWLPWAWWAMERALDQTRTKCRFLWPAPFVYLVLTGGFPYTVLMLALIGSWLALKSLGETRRLSVLWPLSLGVTLGLGLSAPAWLALLDYAHNSVRTAQFDPQAHWQWIVPWSALPGFLYPAWTVRWADFSSRLLPHSAIELACGTVPPLVLLAGLAFKTRVFVRRAKWDLALLAVVLVLATLPTAGIFRWSFRWLPLLHLALALVAAEALAEFRLGPRANWLLVFIVAASLLATYLFVPTNVGVPEYNFISRLTNPQPLDPKRLYLSVYPPPEVAYRIDNHPAPVGQVMRPGSTSMWAAIRLVNGYSPIGGAGISRAFALSTHGEIDRAMADYLIRSEAGPNGLLAILGIDGIILASDSAAPAPPAGEWELVHSSAEGEVFHRRGKPLTVLHAANLPGEPAGRPTISLRGESRNRIQADVDVPEDGPQAVMLISRPYFNGYGAILEGKRLPLASYRGLIPIVRLAPGSHGRLTIVYRPWWLIWGGAVTGLSAATYLFALWRARQAG